jgi:hypothetical protein
MNHTDLQTRAVQSLVRRAEEFRNFLLTTSGSMGGSWQYTSSVSYGSWDLIKLFSDTPRIADEVRTMEGVHRYMSAHRESELYCLVELWSSLNGVFDALARRFSPVELYGSTEKVLASTIKTLELCTKTLSHNHVDFQWARFLLVHSARLLRETTDTLTPANEELNKKLELARVPLAKAICALEKNTDLAAVTARENAAATLAVLQATVA